jgi:hypothetical protein
VSTAAANASAGTTNPPGTGSPNAVIRASDAPLPPARATSAHAAWSNRSII